MNKEYELFKALGDETRLCIVRKLLKGEKRACQIVPCGAKSQPTVSLHLKVLTKAGVVQFRKSGKERIYALKDRRVKRILKILER
jgi:ArsR family transcriptional regulator